MSVRILAYVRLRVYVSRGECSLSQKEGEGERGRESQLDVLA